MGSLLLLWRLVRGDIKRRRAHSVLLVVMLATTTTTLTLGLALHGVNDNPFTRTRTATRGPDVVAMYGVWSFAHPPGAFPGSLARFDALRRAPGVIGSSGPYPITFPQLSARGLHVQALAEGRNRASGAVDRPLLTAGQWARTGGAVVEQAFASALGVRVGDPITLNGRRYRVVGIAITTDDSVYPQGSGRLWLTRADLRRVEAADGPAGYLLNLKIAHPAAAPAFAAKHAAPLASRRAWQAWSLESWQDIQSGDLKLIRAEQVLFLTVGTLLALLALATIAVLVGGRMAEQTRRVGLLKAVGTSPRLIATVLLAEHLLLALTASIVGLSLGRLLAPTLLHTSSGLRTGLLGTPSSSPLTVDSALLVLAAAVVVAAAATLAPAIQGARTSTVSALNDAARPPHHHPWINAISAHLPVVLLLALRLLARRARRAVLATLSLTVAVAVIAVALVLRHDIAAKNAATKTGDHAGMLPGTFIEDRVSHLVFLLSAMLIALAAISIISTTWAAVIDAQQPTAVARALGATPTQITAGLAGAQLLPALVAACLAIPTGIALYLLANHGGKLDAPILSLLAVIPGAVVAVAILTAIPARIGAYHPVADALRAE